MNHDSLPGLTLWPLEPPWYLVHDTFSDTFTLVDYETIRAWIRQDADLSISRQWKKDKEYALLQQFRVPGLQERSTLQPGEDLV